MNEIEKSTLYVVGTPIGNLADISERAKKVLSEVDFVCAEDTRVSGKLLGLYGLKKPLVSYHEHNKTAAAKGIIERLLSGESGAIVTDAGMPAVSDPGQELVKSCRENGIKVSPVPGACAFVSALASSGFPSRAFCFEGFLPQDKKEKKTVLERCKNESRTVIFYEAPHRLLKTLEEFYAAFGERDICLARELTKLNEEFSDMKLSDAVSYYKENQPRGEYVIILGGAEQSEKADFENLTVNQHVEFYISQGYSKMDAIKACAADRNVPKSVIYKEFI